MGAIYRRDGKQFFIVPTANLEAGEIVVVGSIVGVTISPILKNECGTIQTSGEYDVDIEPGTAYFVGDNVTVNAKTLDGKNTTVVFGPALIPIDTTDTQARLKLRECRSGVTDATAGTAGSSIIAPAGASYTTDELKANFATIAAALN